MRIVLEHRPSAGSIRGDRAWRFFCGARLSLQGDRGLWGLANWLWDELATVSGNLNRDSRRSVRVTVPPLEPAALDFVVRIVSFWATDIREQRGRTVSGNLWRRPVINLLRDRQREGAERRLVRPFSDGGSTELNLMPLLGPGRAFFSLQLIQKGDETARMHSHSAVDEYYLILEGRGTLRFNGKSSAVEPGDLIAKPIGPDAATHLRADRGEPLRILDMEVWHERFTGTATTAKDVVYWPDYAEFHLRGPGWGSFAPADWLLPTAEVEAHWHDRYRRTKTGRRVPRRSRSRAA